MDHVVERDKHDRDLRIVIRLAGYELLGAFDRLFRQGVRIVKMDMQGFIFGGLEIVLRVVQTFRLGMQDFMAPDLIGAVRDFGNMIFEIGGVV